MATTLVGIDISALEHVIHGVEERVKSVEDILTDGSVLQDILMRLEVLELQTPAAAPRSTEEEPSDRKESNSISKQLSNLLAIQHRSQREVSSSLSRYVSS